MDGSARDRYLTFVKGLNRLRLVAEGRLEMSARELNELRQDLAKSVPHLSDIAEKADRLRGEMLAHPSLHKERVREIDFILNRMYDPIVFQRQQEIEAFYKEQGGVQAAFKEFQALNDKAESLRSSIAWEVNSIKQLEQMPEEAWMRYVGGKDAALAQASKSLAKTIDDYSELMKQSLILGAPPYLEYDQAWQNLTTEAKTNDWLVRNGIYVAGSLSALAVGGFPALLVFDAGWAGISTLEKETKAGLKLIFDQAGIDQTDAKAVAGFVQNNGELFDLLNRYAVVQSFYAAGDAVIADLLARRLIGDVPIVEDGVALGFNAILEHYREKEFKD